MSWCSLPGSYGQCENGLLAVQLFPLPCREETCPEQKDLIWKGAFSVSWEVPHTLKGLQASTAKSNIKKGRS